MNPSKSIALVCDKNPYTSFGRLTMDIAGVLGSHASTEILWLKTPKYFPGDYDLPDGSSCISAPSLEIGWWSFRRPFRKWLKVKKPKTVLLLRPELGFLIPIVHSILPESKVCMMVHDMFAESLYPDSLKFKLINRFYISPTRKADLFIYNSRYTRTEAHTVMGLPQSDTVVGCPVSPVFFNRPKLDDGTLKQKWGFDRFSGMCLNISLDEPRKNISTFFAIAQARPDVAFVRVGQISSWMRDWLNKNNIGNVYHYSGIPEKDLIELYTCADLFIYPSFAEGFGMPPLEALACGTPVVASAGSALKENLDGVAPLVNPPDNIQGYLAVLDKVLNKENIVNWSAAEVLLENNSIEAFGSRIRSVFGV